MGGKSASMWEGRFRGWAFQLVWAHQISRNWASDLDALCFYQSLVCSSPSRRGVKPLAVVSYAGTLVYAIAWGCLRLWLRFACAKQEQRGWPTREAGSNVVPWSPESTVRVEHKFITINSYLLECTPDLPWERVYHIASVSQALGLV